LTDKLSAAELAPILVVDDDSGVRRLVRSMLLHAGYESSEAGDGLEAYERLQDSARRPTLVITDIQMPRMNGAELAHRLRVEWPDVKILCISAFADPMSPNGHYFLAKPFTAKALLAIVRDVFEIPA
jgi:CheY-like chemotaxis protein